MSNLPLINEVQPLQNQHITMFLIGDHPLKKSGHQSRSGPSPPIGDPSIPFESHEQLPLKIHEHQTSYSLLTRFDSRIALTGPTHISTTPQKGSAPSSYFFFHLEKQAQVPGGWEQQTHLAGVYAHKQHQSCCCYINKLYRHYNKHSTQTRSVHTAIAMPKEYQYFTS